MRIIGVFGGRRSADDGSWSRGGNGWEAWHRLPCHYDPKSPARALMAMMVATQPKKVKEIRELQAAVEEWEVKVKHLKIEHDIELDDQIKVALNLPADLQDYVFQ